jgi:uncharacterized protein
MPNRLANESSPYLLQHAHNPVDWYPWGDEAFEKAKKENKPVLVSIGYAACHWCHVMERESFESHEVATLMNERFINIKVDREERPDVDHIYMDAVQAIEGSGGWPLNVFLTPERKPFYGGTYFPPKRAFNRASWTEVLTAISSAFREKRNEIEQQASNLTQHLEVSNNFGSFQSVSGSFQLERVQEAFSNIMKTADREWGGFGKAPKFPQSFNISFLFKYAFLEKNDEAFQQAVLSLDKMVQGGIYDQIGGGFARYSTDTEWLAPHFEKMLYDNALLVSTMAEAYQLTGNHVYLDTIRDTIGFIERELMHSDGGFFSALDADSEGVEGKFYVWDQEEVNELLGDDAAVFSTYFDISPNGNWEGHNIPRILKPIQESARDLNITEAKLGSIIRDGKQKLLERRSERIRPQLDDKVILGWNALMNISLCKAYAACGEPHFKRLAEKNMDFLLGSFEAGNGLLHHTWKNGKATQPAFLDDYSYLIAALIELAQVSGKFHYLDKAAELTRVVEDHFNDIESPFFFYTHKGQKDIPVRKKEIYDGATPSGNSFMAGNLYRLSILLELPEWKERSEQMIGSLGEVIIKYPTSFGVWLAIYYEIIKGTKEIAIVGKEWEKYLEKILGIYISHKLAMASEIPIPRYPLLADKAETSKILIYLCENYSCRQPVSTLQDFVSLLQTK